MEQQTTDTRSGTPFTLCLEDFRQTVVDIPVSCNHLSVLEVLLFLLNFTGGFSSGKTHTADCSFVSGSYWYTQVCLLLQSPKREETFLRQIFLACGCTSPPYPASTLHSDYWAPNGHNVSLRQGSREEREWDFPMKSSWYPVFQRVIFGSLLIRDSTIEALSGVTVVAIWPQRSSSSNVLAPDMNCLNRLKTVALDGH